VRPKKRILLIDSNEANASTLRFVLETYGFVAVVATNNDDISEISPDQHFDLVIGCWPMEGNDLGTLLARLRAFNPKMSSLLIAAHADQAPESITADIVLTRRFCSVATIIAQVKAMTHLRTTLRKDPESYVHRIMALTARRIA
jgi:CheY-like chemotaxis protein